YAQGVMGVSATNSGAILIPLSLAMILTSIVVGLLISRTGRYREFLILGGMVVVAGYWMLSRLEYGDSQRRLTAAMVVIGLGLGLSMQVYTLVVQNAVAQRALGVATAAVQFFRNIGSTIGTAVLGTVMTSQMAGTIQTQLQQIPAERKSSLHASGGQVDPEGLEAAMLSPDALEQLRQLLVEPIRMGMSEAMQKVFLTALPFVVLALLLALFIKQVPLRDTLQVAEEAPGRSGSGAAAELGGTGSEPEDLHPRTGPIPVVAATPADGLDADAGPDDGGTQRDELPADAHQGAADDR